MSPKRPCRICRKWFEPSRRVGSRQRVCSAAECQQERHRRDCAAWRERQRDEERETQLRERLVPPRAPATAPAAGGGMAPTAPLAEVAWAQARDVVGLEVAVFTEEIGKVLVRWVRDEVQRQVREIIGESRKHAPSSPRDEISLPRRPP